MLDNILNRSVFRIFGCSNADDICFIRAMTNLACIENTAHYRHLMFLGRFASSVPWASAIMHTLEFWWYISVLVRKRKNGPTHEPRYRASAKISFIIAIEPFHRCRRNARKNITVTVSVRVSVTVRVSLVWFVSTNSFGASSVAICRRCVYKILVAFAQRCVYNKSVAYYTRLCI